MLALNISSYDMSSGDLKQAILAATNEIRHYVRVDDSATDGIILEIGEKNNNDMIMKKNVIICTDNHEWEWGR